MSSSENPTKITFKLTEVPDMVMISFNDGNVIIADDKGISTYNTNKTVHIQNADFKVHSTFIEAFSSDDETIIHILPADSNDPDLGLSNDVVLASKKKIRTYTILKEHYIRMRELLWKIASARFDN